VRPRFHQNHHEEHMDKYPQMLYRCPGSETFFGVDCETKVVDSDEAYDEAIAEGFADTPADAKTAHETRAAKADSGPVTRVELEQKALELGIEFDKKTSNKKLAELIEAKLKG
jgi:hypothetical protein